MLNKTTGAFDGARTHDLYITSQTCNPLRHAAPRTHDLHITSQSCNPLRHAAHHIINKNTSISLGIHLKMITSRVFLGTLHNLNVIITRPCKTEFFIISEYKQLQQDHKTNILKLPFRSRLINFMNKIF